MTTYSFNLIDQPWIPCINLDGELIELSLSDTLVRAHELRDIRGDTPLETAALHRLLLAVLHRVFGPKSARAWRAIWDNHEFDASALRDYLYGLGIFHSFDLFDSTRPFFQPRRKLASNNETINAMKPKGKMPLEMFLDSMQPDGVPGVEKKSVISLLLHRSSGDNATLFEHSTEKTGLSLSPAQAARSLIASQLYGFGGTSGVKENFKDAPGAKGILFFAFGNSLFETLALNLVRYGEDHPLPTPDHNDKPAWEMDDPFIPDRAVPYGYLDYLTWHNRRIWLFPEQTEDGLIVREMLWVPGLGLDADDLDPMKHYSANKQDKPIPKDFSSDKALWRDSGVLLQIGGSDRPSQVVQWLARLAQPPNSMLDLERQYKLMALGMSKNQASLEFLRHESIPLPAQFLAHSELVGDLSRGLQIAERVSSRLQGAIFILAWLLLYPHTDGGALSTFEQVNAKIRSGSYPQSKDEEAKRIYALHKSWGVERCYWSDLQVFFHRLIKDLPDDSEQAMQTWRQEVRRTAIAGFSQAEHYASGDLRSQRAAAVARQHFNRGLATVLGKTSANTPSSKGGDKNDPTQ